MSKEDVVLVDTYTNKVYSIGEVMEGGVKLSKRYAKTLAGNNKGRFKLATEVDEKKEQAATISGLIKGLKAEDLEALKSVLGIDKTEEQIREETEQKLRAEMEAESAVSEEQIRKEIEQKLRAEMEAEVKEAKNEVEETKASKAKEPAPKEEKPKPRRRGRRKKTEE